ncbi:MAG: PIN domain-containing protein [Candidatus Margulisbacteria bacterium]|jgi:predicted nucleic acid-binding protein|nr:PIN domain-containing protein [Candidatus Margulisiibacteriota bacterium]
MKEKIFFDNDVILDVSINRKPFLTDAVRLFNLVETGKYRGYTSTVVFTNIYYIQRKLTNHNTAVDFLRKLRLLLTVLNVDDLILQKALASGFSDFEDAVQYFTALQHKMDYILTRNTGDYKKSTIPVYTPLEFLKMLEIKKPPDRGKL